MSLCLWVRAIDNYAKVTKDLGQGLPAHAQSAAYRLENS